MVLEPVFTSRSSPNIPAFGLVIVKVLDPPLRFQTALAPISRFQVPEMVCTYAV